jgi:pimeloyl-ACP methyl ester carboxylesterase
MTRLPPPTATIRLDDPEHDIALDVALTGPPDGEAVILLHGFPESRAEWRDVAPHLTAAGLRVVAPDLRGYSRAARPAGVGQYDQAHLVRDVVGLADALSCDAAHLVGHDWGAMIAWSLAALHPGRVRSLTAVSVPHPAALFRTLEEDPDLQDRMRYVTFLQIPDKSERLLAEDDSRRLRAMYAGIVPSELADHHVSRLGEPGALTGALSYYRAPREPYATLPKVTVPTTYVWGSEDAACNRRASERCGDHVAAPFRSVELAGVSHWAPEEAPADVAEAILRQVRAPGDR